MAKQTKTRYVDLNVKHGDFVSRFISRTTDKNKETKFDFSDLELLRQLLTKEKAKILYTLKNQNVTSIYQLSKLLKRDFKSVWKDLKLLERFGFIEFQRVRKGRRISMIPSLSTETIQIIINI